MSKNNDLMYGLEEYKYNGNTLGWIGEDSFDFGGKKPEFTPIRAAQVKGYAVANLPKTNGTIAPTFDLIQFNYLNMSKVLGGRILMDEAKTKAIGWVSPSGAVQLSGFHEIYSDSGQVVVIPKALVLGSIHGGLTLTDTSKLNLEIAIEQPADGLEAIYMLDADEYKDNAYDPENPEAVIAYLKTHTGYTLEEYQGLVSEENG